MAKYKSSDFKEPLKELKNQMWKVKRDPTISTAERDYRYKTLYAVISAVSAYSLELKEKESEELQRARAERLNVRNFIQEG